MSNKIERFSNIELYRILSMFMIVAHHLVVSSGLSEGPMMDNPATLKTLVLWCLGMWGKTGINCFLFITGYFMCKSNISFRKFLKLLLEVYFYNILFFIVFAILGRENLGPSRFISLIMPIWGIHGNFLSCFLCFYLTIPFWNVLIHNMSKKQHQLLLLLGIYTIGGSIYSFKVIFNYVTWFGIIYLIASYIRIYPASVFEQKNLWGTISLGSIILAIVSMIVLQILYGADAGQFFVYDSNKLFAVVVSVSTFLWFKNMKIPYVKWINIIGGSTFGVFLIHTNSNAMRKWLWGDVVGCVDAYSFPLFHTIVYFILSVILIFTVSIVIDRFRIIYFERPFFVWFDKKNRVAFLEKLWQN